MGIYGPLRTQRGVSGAVTSGIVNLSPVWTGTKLTAGQPPTGPLTAQGFEAAWVDGTQGVHMLVDRTLQSLAAQLTSDGAVDGSGPPLFDTLYPSSGTNDASSETPAAFRSERNAYAFQPTAARLSFANLGSSRAQVTVRVHVARRFHDTYADPLSVGYAGLASRYGIGGYIGTTGYVAAPPAHTPSSVDDKSPLPAIVNYTSGEYFGRFFKTTFTRSVYLNGGKETVIRVPIPGARFVPEMKLKESQSKTAWFNNATTVLPGVTYWIVITVKSLSPAMAVYDQQTVPVQRKAVITYAPAKVVFIGSMWNNIYRHPSARSPPMYLSDGGGFQLPDIRTYGFSTSGAFEVVPNTSQFVGRGAADATDVLSSWTGN